MPSTCSSSSTMAATPSSLRSSKPVRICLMKMAKKMARTWKLVTGSVAAWSSQNALEWGAALAYYTAFSIAPLLIIALSVVGLVYKGDSLGYIHAQIVSLVGEHAATAITSAIRSVMEAEHVTSTSIVSIVVGIFAAIYKIVTDVHIDWQDVWTGAIVTAVLFTAGKAAISFYIGRTGVGSAYGAAGSVMILLAWVYYSSQILFLGAEFTKLYAEQRRFAVRPLKGAAAVTPAAKQRERGEIPPPEDVRNIA